MTARAERMAAQAPMGDAERLARDVEHPEPGSVASVTSGHGRPRASTTSSWTTLMTLAHPASIPCSNRSEDVLADHTHDLPGRRPVVDTAWQREIRVDAQLHHDPCR